MYLVNMLSIKLNWLVLSVFHHQETKRGIIIIKVGRREGKCEYYSPQNKAMFLEKRIHESYCIFIESTFLELLLTTQKSNYF